MFANDNMKQIKRELNQNNKHTKYRRVARPKTGVSKHMVRPFSGLFNDGTFRNDIYFSMSPFFIASVYIKFLLIHCAPALLLHAVMYGIHRVNIAVVGDDYSAPTAAYQILFVAYAICLYFAYRKITDHMAYYNIEMLISKYDINQKFLTSLYKANNDEMTQEMTVMDHYRMKFNKHSLFPSMKELALEEQLYQDGIKSDYQNVRQYAMTRHQRLTIVNKRQEHLSAKTIADMKQAKHGGENEYDAMVRKYKYRTVPAIREIIREAQQQPNYYA